MSALESVVRASGLEHVGEVDCETCHGEGQRDRDVENAYGGLVALMLRCVDCEGTGKMLCCNCGERPAVFAYYWFRKQPGYVGDAVDELCETCSRRPAYTGGLS